jgi:hypothetical protein
VFISLAEDSPEELKAFLFKDHYCTSVPNLKTYMNNTLQISGFPHFIVNKNGIIEKVTSKYQDLEIAWKIVSK